jgi:sugar phosphate isomerase/epimerase
VTASEATLNLGCSLPLDYLAGDETLSAAGSSWREAFGSAGLCLDDLRRAGVGSVELRSVAPDAGGARVLLAARRARDAGMEVTIHGRLPGPDMGNTCAEAYPSLLPLAEALAGRGCESVVTMHCYSTHEGSVQDLAEQTVRTLRRLVGILTREAIPLRVGSSRVGACWDFGHGYMNVQHGVDACMPGAAFLDKVIHAHVHDLGPRTHCPLTHGVVPLALYLDALIGQRYTGVLNLELSPERFSGPVRELVHASIDCLAR